MQIFEFIRPKDSAAAIAAAAQSKTAQQGADVRFMGGGTTLIDLMKLDVMRPDHVIDINALGHSSLGQIVLSGEGTRLGALVTQRHARRNLTQIVVATLLPTTARARKLVMELASPFDDEEEKAAAERNRGASDSAGAGASVRRDESLAAGPNAAASPAASAAPSFITNPRAALTARWQKIRPYLWLPLAGPLVMTGFLGAIFNLFVLGPLLSLAWRQRKYMADATAVRLTRDPDTLAGALDKVTGARGSPLAPWAAHMSVADHGGHQAGVFGRNAVPMFPSIDRRLRALGAMGAHITRAARPQLSLRAWLLIAPLLAILAVLVAILFPLLIWLSLALTMLFTGMPFAIVHALLRWLGHH